MAKKFIACGVKEIEDIDVLIDSGKTAVGINSTNSFFERGLSKVMEHVLPERKDEVVEAIVGSPAAIAMLTSKDWGSDGVDLGVSFMETTDPALRDKILAYMNKWNKWANVRFRWSQSGGEVRISRGGGGYYSYLGTDVLHIPKNQQTMNLEGFTLRTSDEEYDRVVTHETGHCLAAGTLIDCPRDLGKYPQGIPISELVGNRPWVYAWKDGKIVVRKASRVWRSKRNVRTVRVRLRTGKGFHKGRFLPPLEIVGTPDHPVLLADGVTWKKLGKLRAGDRLCSLYHTKNGKRSNLRWTGSGYIREHVFVAQEVYGPRPEGHDCHHKDENQLNQEVDNLEWKLEAGHVHDHMFGRKRSSESIAKTAAFWRGRKHSDETRAKMSAAQKNKALMSDEQRMKVSKQFKGKKQSPELIEKRRQAMLKFYANGGRSGMYGKTASAETRRRRSESMKAARARKHWANHIVVSVEPWLYQDVYDMTVPDADSFVANGVVVHNSLGCPHEHMRRDIIARLDEAKTLAYFLRTQRWDAAMTRAQVLTPIDERSITGTPADVESIMAYQLPGSITIDGRPIPGGVVISDRDGQFMGTKYPLAVRPPVSAAKRIVLLCTGDPGSVAASVEAAN